MKCYHVLILTAIALSLSTTGLRAEEIKGVLGKAAGNKIYAQQLVNDLLARNSDLVVIGVHATKPGAKDETMIASNLDRIGKIDDADDVAVATEHKTICAPNPTDPHKFEVLTPMKDATGNFIGSIGFVFKYQAGDNEVQLHARGVELRDELAKKIPSLAALLSPVK